MPFNGNATTGKKRLDGSVFSADETLRRVRQNDKTTISRNHHRYYSKEEDDDDDEKEEKEEKEEENFGNNNNRPGGRARRSETKNQTMRVKEHKAKPTTTYPTTTRETRREHRTKNAAQKRSQYVEVVQDIRRREDEGEDASYISRSTDAATFGGSGAQIQDDYYVEAKWNNADDGIKNIEPAEEEEFTFRSTSVGESVRSELENARRASANTTANAATMSKKTEALDGIRRDVDDTIDNTVAHLLEMIENERLKSSTYEKNLEKTEKAYLETKKESEEIAERLTGAANIISELKSALVHAMREQHDDDKFEDDVNDAVNDTRMRRGGPSSDLSNSVEAVGARRWEAKLRRMVSSALERFTSEASGVPNGDALYKAAKEALDPVVASAIAGVVDEIEIASGKKNKKKEEDKDYFRKHEVDNSYSLDDDGDGDDDDDDDDDDNDDPTSRIREHEQDVNSLDGRAKLVAWMQMEKAKRKRLTRRLLKTKDELAKSEASRMAATRRWLEAASQLESERGSQFTQSIAGDGMGSSSDEEGFFDDDESDEGDHDFTPKSVQSRRTDHGLRTRARKTHSLDGSGDAALFFMQTPTSPSLNEGIRRRKSKSASASLVDPSSPSKNYGTFSPFSPGSGRVKSTGSKSTLSKRSGSSNRKHQNRNSRLGFEDRIDEEDEEEDKEDDDEKRKVIRSLDVSTEIQKTIQSVTRNQTFRDVARTIATTIEQFASSPTFELVWPICFVTFLVFWRASFIALHATAAVEQQQQQQQQQRVLKVVEGSSLSEASVPRVSPPPPLPRERQRYRQPSETSYAYQHHQRIEEEEQQQQQQRKEEEEGDRERAFRSHETAPRPLGTTTIRKNRRAKEDRNIEQSRRNEL